MKKFILTTLVAVSIWGLGFSQTITRGQTIEHYIENVFVGTGVTVSNVTISPSGGVSASQDTVIGEFSGFENMSLGLDHGFVFVNGSILNILNAPN